eukprot:TRINITY_DN11364_c0_g1_i1.p2 TRINITY_DN11364_c0_g1~~TRINITY_DN11364_c0_g1_i1.p2  ORF type:complete len:170 (-),score=43.36 TRINITY_DN11364_c0_g1_i1:322-831(-)
MRKRLPHLTLAELKAECIRMELVEENEELIGKKKAELVVLVKDHLITCGSDPANFLFSACLEADEPPAAVPSASSHPNNLGVSQPPPFSLSGPRRGHRWATWADEFQIYASLFGDLPPERKTALLLHCRLGGATVAEHPLRHPFEGRRLVLCTPQIHERRVLSRGICII